MTLFLVNPGDRMPRKTRRRTPPRNKDGTFRKRRSATAKRRRRNPPKRRAATTTRKRSTTVARKRTTTRRRPTRRRATTRRRTTRRRNPDIIKTVTKATKGAAFILAGEAATKAIPGRIGLPTTGTSGLAIKAATAIAVGMAADKFVGREAGARVLEGGIACVLRELVAGAGIPVVSGALSSYASVPVANVRRVRGVPTQVPAFSSYANVGPTMGSYATTGGAAVAGGA